MKYVPAAALEELVEERVRELGTDEGVVESIVEDANKNSETEGDLISKRRTFLEPKSGGCAWMQSATALAGWACTKTKAHPVGELRLLGKRRAQTECGQLA